MAWPEPAQSHESEVVFADCLLRLEDPRLEADYWRQPGTMGGPDYDLVCCVIAVFLQLMFVGRSEDGGGGGSSGSAAIAGFRAAHRAMTLLPLAHAAAIVLARPAYLRHRVRVQAGLRFARLLFQFCQACVTQQAAVAWRGRLLHLARTNPERALIMPFIAPVACLVHTLMNPGPLALQPAIAACVIFLALFGWAPLGCETWRHPPIAAAMEGLCARLAEALLFVDSAAIVVFGAPLTYASGGALQPLTRERAMAVYRVFWLAVMLSSIAFSVFITYRVELRSKQQYLRSRGLQLRVRAPALGRLAAEPRPRGAPPQAARLAGAPAGGWPPGAIFLAAPLLLWQLAELLVRTRRTVCTP